MPALRRRNLAALEGGQRMSEEIEFFCEPRFEQEGDLWAAYCDELQLASAGANKEEAETNLLETLRAFARALRKKGLLEDTLTKAGLKWRSVESEGLRVVI